MVSHWLLDLVVHRPDLPIFPGGPRFGLGLWSSLPATLGVELAFFAAGLGLYLRATRARDRAGSLGLWSLVAFLLTIQAANLLGPPPPSVPAIAWAGQAQWLLVAWAYWLDRHREPVSPESPSSAVTVWTSGLGAADRARGRRRIEEVREELAGRPMSDSGQLIRELRDR